MRVLSLLVVLVASSVSHATEPDRGIAVESAWARELPPVSPNGAAYLTLHNAGPRPDALVRVQTPVAAQAQLHAHEMAGGMMRMRRLDSVALPPGETVRMDPGGLHLMLIGLEVPLRRGERFALTLHFREAPPLEVQVQVRAPGQGGAGHGHGTKAH
jgi:copper(I)-binding protein